MTIANAIDSSLAIDAWLCCRQGCIGLVYDNESQALPRLKRKKKDTVLRVFH